MTVTGQVNIFAHQMWPQGDARDPLGVWGGRQRIVGDASAGAIQSTFVIPQALRGKYVYTVYSMTAVQNPAGTVAASNAKGRILTNWPNISIDGGVQGYATCRIRTIQGSTTWRDPKAGSVVELVEPNDRFLLIHDPHPASGSMTLAEIDWAVNTDGDTYDFEIYGYHWDRLVFQTPGGPRHPGSS